RRAREALGAHERVARVVQRGQVRRDRHLQSTRRRSGPLPRLNRGPREDEPADFSDTQCRDTHRDRQERLAGASRTDRKNEIVLADGLDVGALVVRLRRDPFPARGCRYDLAHLGRRRDRCLLRIADEPLQRGLSQGLIAPGQRAHRADEIADARDCRRLAADAQLRATRHDFYPELALESIDVRFVIARDEHHLVGIRDEDRDLRCRRAHDARSRRSAATTPETTFPSARPFVSAMTFGITTFVSCGPLAPVSLITLFPISWLFASVGIAARRKRTVSRRRVSPERIAATRSLSSRCFNCALMRLAPRQRLRRFASLRLRRAAGLS